MSRTAHESGIEGAKVIGGLSGAIGAQVGATRGASAGMQGAPLVKYLLKSGLKWGAIGALLGYPVAALTKAAKGDK